MIALISAFGIIILFFSVESKLRYGDDAKSFKTTEKDKRSTSYLGIVFGINFIVLISGFLINHYKIGLMFNHPLISFLGNLIMVAGLFIRIFATRTLKEYYTRTLKIQDNQKIVDFGLYKYLRHPGYLGVILLWTGAGLSANSYFVFIVVTLITIIVYHYRMNSEEEMLIEAFGEKYQNYKAKTWRLIPMIY